MVAKLTLGLAAMACCVIIHAGGVTWALRRLRQSQHHGQGFWPLTWICVRLAGLMIGCHLSEIALWGLMYTWQGAMPDAQTAFYFTP